MAYIFKYQDCNICGSDERIAVGKRIPRSYFVEKGLITNIVKCKRCGLVYPYPMPFADDEQLKKNYSDPLTYFPAEISEERLKFYDSILRKINAIVPNKGRLLDVGCGRGELLYVAKNYGWQACGVDISPNFARYAKERFNVDVRIGDIKRLDFEAESFDVITLIALLDHVYNPRGLILDLNQILKKDGFIFIETMNTESLLYKLGNLYYRLKGMRITTSLSPTFPSFQVYGFSSGPISKLLQTSGFKIIKMQIKGGISKIEKVAIKNFKERLLRYIRFLCIILADLFKKGQVLAVCAQKDSPRVLFVPYGTRLAPATRYRVYQYLSFLEHERINYKVYSIISKGMTVQMIKSSTFNRFQRFIYYVQVVIEKFVRVWKVIFLASKFDLIFLQRSTFLFGLERLLKLRNKNIIFDIDDSIYMPDRQESGLIGRIKKYIKKKEVVSVLKISKCVIVENSHIKSFVKKYCNKIYVITGPIDTNRNYARQYNSNLDIVTIGWIGTPSTIIYLRMVDEVLRELGKKYKIKVKLIGSGTYSIDGVKVEVVDWNEETEVSELHKFDIGVMPMPDNEWTRGKVGCKMLQYMANGIPAIVSYTPTNAEVIEDGVNGFLANSDEEWIDKISRLIEDPILRRDIGLAGRKSVEERYSLDVNAARFIRIIKGKG